MSLKKNWVRSLVVLAVTAGFLIIGVALCQPAPQHDSGGHGQPGVDSQDRTFQSRMQSALQSLKNAERQLSIVQRERGGHRGRRALDLVSQAISAVEEGMRSRYDDRGPDSDRNRDR